MPQQASFAFVLMSLCITSAGCGTLHNIEDDPEPAVYGGVRWEVPEIRERGGSDMYGDAAVVIHCLDLPLTLIGDTVTLPYTIPCSLWRLCQGPPSYPPPPPIPATPVPSLLQAPAGRLDQGTLDWR
jgi:uncharacterized protein YceK